MAVTHLSFLVTYLSHLSPLFTWVVAKEDGEEKIMLSGTLGESSLKLKWAWITQFAISPETALRLILSSCFSEKDNRGACTWFKCPLLCDWQEVLFTFSAKQNHFHLKAGFKQTPEQSLFPLFPVNHITAASARLNVLMEHCHCNSFQPVWYYYYLFLHFYSRRQQTTTALIYFSCCRP